VTILKCSGGVSIAELDEGTLEENIEGCVWDMKLIFKGNDYMPVEILYWKRPC
jgi:hypothetical protein